MFAERSRKNHLAAAIVILGSLLATSIAFAKIARNTIDPVAVVTDGGEHIIATGPIACSERERVHLRVTVTQRSTGALAEGRTLLACAPETRQWKLHASLHGEKTFEAGPATAVAVARSVDRGIVTDAHQWLVEVTLLEE